MEKSGFKLEIQGQSVHFTSQYLVAGLYQFRIVAPFDTRMIVSPDNPAIALRDLNPEPNIFNSDLRIPADGQYAFRITLDKPVDDAELQVWIIPQDGDNNDQDDDPDDPPDNEPTEPQPGWQFIYAYDKYPNNRIRVTVRNGTYFADHFQADTGAVQRNWSCRRESTGRLTCSEAQTPGLVQKLDHSADWSFLLQGKFRYNLVAKQRI